MMWRPNDPSRFLAGFKYVEWGTYIPEAYKGKGGLIRASKKGEPPKLFSWEEIRKKAEARDLLDVYTSIGHYNDRNPAKAQVLSNLFFDLDYKADASVAHEDAKNLVAHLLQFIPESAISIFFSGMKGFHIELEAAALGIGPLANLVSVFRTVANDMKDTLGLQSLDFQVFDVRRMWRIPNTQHSGSRLYKIPLKLSELTESFDTIRQLAETPRDFPLPEQEFDSHANEWFREYVYKTSVPEETKADMLERFAKHGTGITRDQGEKQFDPFIFEKCKAMGRLWQKAEDTHHLEHEERLFLLSILSYSDEALWYLHQILSLCNDYNVEKSESHIKDWIRRRELGIGGHPYSCSRANSVGIGCGDCAERMEVKEKWLTVGDKMVPTGEAASPSPIRYAYTRKKK